MPRFLICLLGTVLLSGLPVDGGQTQPVARDVHGDPLPSGAVARLGTVRFRHETAVVFAAFLPGGKAVLSVSQDGVLCAWELPSGTEIRRVEMLAGTAATVTGATL